MNRPNLMIKVPAAPEGFPAVEELIAQGLNVNVTLMFSLEQYEAAARRTTAVSPGWQTQLARHRSHRSS